jgi:hypothetical protein
MRAYAVRLLRLRRIEFSVHTGTSALPPASARGPMVRPNSAGAVSHRPARAHRRCLAAPVAHIAEHFTIVGKNCLPIHAKSIGRYDRRGVKLQHGSVLFIWAMRELRRLDGAGDAA